MGGVRFEDLARASVEVAGTSARLAKVARLAAVLADLSPREAPVAVAYLSGLIPGGTVGVGWASLRHLPPPAPEPSLGLLEVQGILERIRAATGRGSRAARAALLADLFRRATELERRFLVGLLLGEVRQGALEGVMVDAVARAARASPEEVRRALMLAGGLGEVAAVALAEGPAGLARFGLTVLRPLKPMLAAPADDLGEALRRAAPAALEWKLDGVRIQVHRLGQDVRVFTRNLAEATDRVPEVVAAVASLPVRAAVLDGEAIALRPDGRPRPFQETMSRFGSRLDAARLPLAAFFFDLLHLDGADLLDRPLEERWARLAAVVPEELRVPRVEDPSAPDARRFLDDALARGHEGVMVKALRSPYEAGRRGASWLKVKPAHTLDLVVLAAEWGHGRRRGWLSNLHLGARDPATGGFVMLGKTFKGLTDEMLAWQTDRLLALETAREGHVVHVRPELVVEVAFDGVQASPRYPGGIALRFARVRGYRPDKRAGEADTVDAVRALRPRA
ncbi:MAG TPA: ATP-dependent DNA ligase [Actinomycetota bacterium]|nr:ATP-dependent DNA ligase [Actinomycetota bacterium]